MSFSAWQALWSASIVVIPLALLVIVLVSLTRCRPATRHALWVGVMLSLLAPLLLAITGIAAPLRTVGASVGTLGEHARTALTTAHAAWTTVPRSRANEVPNDVELTDTVDERPQAPRVVADAPATTRQTPRREAPEVARFVSPFEPERTARRLPDRPRPTRSPVPFNSDPLPGAVVADSPGGADVEPAISLRQDAPAPIISTLADAPPPAAEAPVEIADETTASYNVSAWVTWLTTLRDAMVSLPPIPPILWVIGVLAVVIGWLVRSGRSRHILRHATPAPDEIVRLVQRESERIGLRRPPQTLMVTAKISPSILCDLRPRLAIPVDLWAQFDDASRRAAVVHELAHLRRRDHWVMWLETVVGAIYWWHPLVWWIRRRLREEADLCCDAWVTTLMPRERRAYAEALVLTKAYLSCPGPREHRIGIGMASAHAKKFARRVTMVMTQRGTPRMSVWGAALTSAITLAGLVAAPTIACPPEKKNKTEKVAKVVVAPEAPTAPMASKPAKVRVVEPSAPSSPFAVTETEPDSTFEQHMRGDDRIDRLERRIERLEQRIDQLIRVIERGSPGVVPAPTSEGETSQRLYVLPDGKLSELTALMVRQDVPILVSPRDDGLIVYATPSQHQAFSNFVTMIHPEHGQHAAQDAPPEHAEAIYEWNELADEHAEHVRRGEYIRHQQQLHREQYNAASAEYRNQINAMNAQAQDMRQASNARLRETRQLYREMERIQNESQKHYDKAEHYYVKAEGLMDQAEEMMEEAEENDSDELRAKAERLFARAHEHEARADAYEAEAHALESQAENLEDAADQVEESAHELNDRAEEFEDRAHDLEERLHELMEELEEILEDLEEDDDHETEEGN